MIGEIPGLVTFFASNNQLKGPVPSFTGNQGKLQAVNLSQNRLQGTLDDFFSANGPIGRLLTVDVGMNDITGTIPTTVGLYDSLTDLVLKGNPIDGDLPTEIGSLVDLDTLSLSNCQLKGTIPEELGHLTRMLYLDLGRNSL